MRATVWACARVGPVTTRDMMVSVGSSFEPKPMPAVFLRPERLSAALRMLSCNANFCGPAFTRFTGAWVVVAFLLGFLLEVSTGLGATRIVTVLR